MKNIQRKLTLDLYPELKDFIKELPKESVVDSRVDFETNVTYLVLHLNLNSLHQIPVETIKMSQEPDILARNFVLTSLGHLEKEINKIKSRYNFPVHSKDGR